MSQINCKNCAFSHFSVFPATREDPEDIDFYCTNDSDKVLQHLSIEQGLDPEDVDGSLGEGDEAEKCPCYQNAQSEVFDEDCFAVLTPQEKQELDALAEQYAYRQAIELGWVDSLTGEATDAYFRASDFAYDAARGA